jgi:hypothetical protein
MGDSTTAYLAYGMKIPNLDSDTIEQALNGNTNGAGYLTAGPYDRDSTYLVTAFHEAELGAPTTPDLASHYADGDPTCRWNNALDHAAGLLGLADHEEPAWHLIADVS